MPLPERPFDEDDDRDERDVTGDEITESFAEKDLDELQDEFADEDARQSER